jgi:hypothetical protein
VVQSSFQGIAMPKAKALGITTSLCSIFALVVTLAAIPADAQDYPPGLFESSPVVPSGPPSAAAPAEPSSPDGVPADDYCANVALQVFDTLAELRQAHARCDHDQDIRPAPRPSGQPDQCPDGDC